MTLVDRTGWFRGNPTAGVVKLSTGGFPQLTLDIDITEMLDPVSGEWVDWSEYGHSIRAFLILFNASKAMANYPQVMKALDWDGTDMGALQNDDYGDRVVLFEVIENTYEGKTSLKVNWIDAADAECKSGGELTPIDSNAIASMNAQYGQFMNKPAAAAPARAGKPKAKRGRPKKNAAAPTPAVPTVPPVAPTSPPPVIAGGTLTQESAWTAVNEAAAGAKTVADITKAWLTSVAEVSESSGIVANDFTGEEWDAVRQTALDILI